MNSFSQFFALVFLLCIFLPLSSATSLEAQVSTLPGGITYQEIHFGHGEEVAVGDKIKVNFKGCWTTREDKSRFHTCSQLEKKFGSEKREFFHKFHDTYERNQPFTFEVGKGEILEGWDRGVVGIKVGGRRSIFLPSAYGYKQKGLGDIVPPGADLIFDVTVISILKRAEYGKRTK